MPEPQNVHSSATSPTSIVRCWARLGAPKAPAAVAAAAVERNVRRAMALLILFSLRVRVLGGRAEIAGAIALLRHCDHCACSIAAAKGYDGRKRICLACVAQSRATSSVRTKRGRREKGSKSNSHSIPFASSREPHIADGGLKGRNAIGKFAHAKLHTKLWRAGR